MYCFTYLKVKLEKPAGHKPAYKRQKTGERQKTRGPLINEKNCRFDLNNQSFSFFCDCHGDFYFAPMS